MDPTTFSALALACAPAVHASTTHALVAVESGFNPNAIGVVGGVLDRQPRTRAEALATADRLQAAGWNFSLGLAQINRRNFDRLGLTPATALDPCANLRAMQALLDECFERASQGSGPQTALRQSLSCYYSGNFVTGFRHGYVQRVAQRVMRAAAVGRRASGVPP
ncbi:lytic transglycosylase domain-containing protein [Ideonella sp. A 288]|uniref:lytic transglycosylase domain-containing protein n=1 Tax=Ideonella sp. A 288 TaxID=1962181 RepID=UPI000B4B4016|nr:lytic transglycosylase domain-containing protein [Ideonella sp. A 288]